jgi:predicted NodU family carbamoyl transferase
MAKTCAGRSSSIDWVQDQDATPMTTILGISAFYHDSAAALVVDGRIVAAAQEERFSRKKHDPGFPANAVAYCLQAGNLHPEDLDYVAFYDKPLLKFDRLLETYLAFAPAVLRERAAEYFALPADVESPYMLLVAPVHEKHRTTRSAADQKTMTEDPDLRRRVNVVRSTLPAVTHVDFSARLQTVDEPRHGRFYRLLKAFERRTGCPVLVNTSFNVRGEPIVCSPTDALRCFLSTDMDVLVLEDFVVRKDQMPKVFSAAERATHLATFERD